MQNDDTFDLREFILINDDRVIEAVPVPEWKGPDGNPVTVYIRSVSSDERTDFEKSCIKETKYLKKGKVKSKSEFVYKQFVAKLIALTAVRGLTDTTPLFTESDIAILATKNAKPVSRLFEAAQRLSGFTDEDIEELTGNSGADQNG